MRIYVDSSALIKRAVDEPESDSVDAALEAYVDADHALVSSSLAWIEVSRALRSRLDGAHDEIGEAIDVSLSGVAEWTITPEVVSLARRIGPTVLRSLDAIHVATAVLLDADRLISYDERVNVAARHNGIAVETPSQHARPDETRTRQP